MDAEFSSWLRSFFSIVSVLWRLRFQSIFKNRQRIFFVDGENRCEVLCVVVFFSFIVVFDEDGRF